MGEDGTQKGDIAIANKSKELTSPWVELYDLGKNKEASDLYAEDVICVPSIEPGGVLRGRKTLFDASLGFRKAHAGYRMVWGEVVAAEGGTAAARWVGRMPCPDAKIAELREWTTGVAVKYDGGVEYATGAAK